MELLIRDAMPDDAAGIVSVFNPIIEAHEYTLFDTPFTVEAERSYIAGLSERDIFNVAVRASDNSVVGFQSMAPFATYTHAFDHVGVIGTYVDLRSRRQGVATCLFPARWRWVRPNAVPGHPRARRASLPAEATVLDRRHFPQGGRSFGCRTSAQPPAASGPLPS